MNTMAMKARCRVARRGSDDRTHQPPPVRPTAGTALRRAAAVLLRSFCLGAFLCSLAPTRVAAQDPVLDSLNVLFDSLTAALLDDGPRHTISVRPVYRGYSVGGSRVSERALGLTYALRTGAYQIRIGTAGPVRYSGATSTIDAVTPIEATVDVRIGLGDSLRVTARSSSFPGSLDSNQLDALAELGTSTVELESVGLGTPAVAGVRLVLVESVGPLDAALRIAADFEPRPDVVDSVYWRGTTLRLGMGLAHGFGATKISTSIDFSHSYADSLDGRNLFPGGGSLVARVEVESSLGEFGEVYGFGSAYYYRPLGLERPDQPNRRIPFGSVQGGYVGFMLPIWSVYVVPVVGVAREANSGDLDLRRFTFQSNGSSWALTASSSLSIPITRTLFLTPEAGFVRGGVRGEFVQLRSGDLRPIEFAFADDVDGWYAALDLSFSF